MKGLRFSIAARNNEGSGVQRCCLGGPASEVPTKPVKEVTMSRTRTLVMMIGTVRAAAKAALHARAHFIILAAKTGGGRVAR